MTNEKASEILFMQWQDFLEHNIDYAGISDAYKKAFEALKLIPDNATNGDVIKALFPNATYEHINKMSGVNFTRVKGLNAFEFPQDFYDEWWNAPYKRGGEVIV